jgi:hypothetical protein
VLAYTKVMKILQFRLLLVKKDIPEVRLMNFD